MNGQQTAESRAYANTKAPTEINESPSKIRDAVGGSEEAKERLHAIISELEKRLETVLTPTTPQADALNKSATHPSPVSSHLHNRIGDLNAGYMHAVDRLRDLLRRIEV